MDTSIPTGNMLPMPPLDPTSRLIPDITLLIARWLTKKELTICCRVSRLWHDLWVGYVWETIVENKNAPPVQYIKTHGHHIRSIYNGHWRKREDIRAAIRLCCPNLVSLDLTYPYMSLQDLDTMVLGIHRPESTILEPDEDELALEDQSRTSESAVQRRALPKSPGKAVTYRVIYNPLSGYFSNHLRTIHLAVEPEACQTVMHWFGLAARRGRLLGLESFEIKMRRGSTWMSRRRVEYLRLSFLVLFLRSMPWLRKLAITEGGYLYDDLGALIAVPVTWTSDLTDLSLFRVESPVVLSHILVRTPNISKLRIKDMDEPGYLEMLLKFCPRLDRFFPVPETKDLKPRDWISFFEKFPQLRHVEFDSTMPGINDKVLEALVKSCGPNLLTFGLHNAPNVSWRGLAMILRGCSALEGLNLSYLRVSPVLFHNLPLDSEDAEMNAESRLWACYDSLKYLNLGKISMTDHPVGNEPTGSLNHSIALRKHLHRLTRIEKLEVGGRGLMTHSLLPYDEIVYKRRADGTGTTGEIEVPAKSKVFSKLAHLEWSGRSHFLELEEIKDLMAMVPAVQHLDLGGHFDGAAEVWLRKYYWHLEEVLHLWEEEWYWEGK